MLIYMLAVFAAIIIQIITNSS